MTVMLLRTLPQKRVFIFEVFKPYYIAEEKPGADDSTGFSSRRRMEEFTAELSDW